MIDQNPELREFIKEFKTHHNDEKLLKFFNNYKKYFRLKQYHDPSGVLEYEDIESVALIGFWKAIEKYDETKWDNAIGWCYYIIRQQILREIKNVYKKENTYINSHMNPNLLIEELSEDLYEEENVSNKVDLTEYHLSDIQELCSRLEDVNITASKVFQLKLAFPILSRNSMAKILGFKRRNGLAKIVKQIRKIAFDNLHKELQDGRLTDPFKELF